MKNQSKVRPARACDSYRESTKDGHFSLTKRLSGKQRIDIDKALRRHRIMLDELSFSSLCSQIEIQLMHYLWAEKDPRKNKISRPEFIRDVERIQKALEALSVRSRDILSWCSLHTEPHRNLEELVNVHDFFKKLNGDDFDNERINGVDVFGFSVLLLKKTCELALNNPPLDIGGEGNVVESNTAVSGRPTNHNKRRLVYGLASAFSSATGRKATDTANGPFDDFLSACLEVVIPKYKAESNRKLIKSALDWDVPKPRN